MSKLWSSTDKEVEIIEILEVNNTMDKMKNAMESFNNPLNQA